MHFSLNCRFMSGFFRFTGLGISAGLAGAHFCAYKQPKTEQARSGSSNPYPEEVRLNNQYT